MTTNKDKEGNDTKEGGIEKPTKSNQKSSKIKPQRLKTFGTLIEATNNDPD